MLVLGRKRGERIVIDDGERKVTVEVLRIDGPRVLLGVVGDRSIPVRRVEQEERKGA